MSSQYPRYVGTKMLLRYGVIRSSTSILLPSRRNGDTMARMHVSQRELLLRPSR